MAEQKMTDMEIMNFLNTYDRNDFNDYLSRLSAQTQQSIRHHLANYAWYYKHNTSPKQHAELIIDAFFKYKQVPPRQQNAPPQGPNSQPHQQYHQQHHQAAPQGPRKQMWRPDPARPDIIDENGRKWYKHPGGGYKQYDDWYTTRSDDHLETTLDDTATAYDVPLDLTA